jgi:hypothetical protein
MERERDYIKLLQPTLQETKKKEKKNKLEGIWQCKQQKQIQKAKMGYLKEYATKQRLPQLKRSF